MKTLVHEVTLEFEDQSRLNLEDFPNAMKLQPLRFSSPEVSLYLDVDVIHPNGIMLKSDTGEISTGRPSCEWYLSYGPGSPEELYELLQQGICELLVIRGDKYWWECLVTKRIKNFSIRIGVCRALFEEGKPPA